MANTSAVYARIDTGLKTDAESIFAQLGITLSDAIQMLYSRIVLTKSLPFDLRLPVEQPVAIGNMSREQLNSELAKGVSSIKGGKAFSADEVDARLAEEFGI